jgi:hypothetical protein
MTLPNFCDYLPFEEYLALDLYNIKFLLPMDDLYQVWLKLGLLVLEKIFSDFLLFCYYLPLEVGVVFHLYNSESPLPKDNLCQLWVKFAQWFWRSRKCKSLIDRQTIRKAQLSFQLRRAENLSPLTHYEIAQLNFFGWTVSTRCNEGLCMVKSSQPNKFHSDFSQCSVRW